MEILLITVGIPGLGLLMLLCWRGMLLTGISGSEVRQKKFLGVLSVLMGMSAIVLAVLMVLPWLTQRIGPPVLILTVVRLVVLTVVAWTARAAWQVSREPYREQPSVAQLAIRASQLRTVFLGSLALIALPLLAIGSLPLLAIWSLGFVEYALFELVTKARRCRLLWTLAIATRFQKPLETEVLQLARHEATRQQRRLQQLALALEEGNSLSQALAAVPGLLPLEMIAAIQASEATGQVEQVLQSFARQQTSGVDRWLGIDLEMNNFVLYSLICLVIYLSIVSFIMYYIIPKFKAILWDFGVELPESTYLLIVISDAVVNYWFLAFFFFGIPLMLLMYVVLLCLGYEGRYLWLAETIWPRIRAPGLLRSLSAGVRAQATPIAVLEGYTFGVEPSLERHRLERLALRMEEGQPVGTALFEERYLNQREAHAVRIAEERGHLAWALESIARRLEVGRSSLVRTVLEFLKPVFVLLIGLLVLFFCTAMFSVLTKLLNDLS